MDNTARLEVLTDREFELLKVELGLLDQRVIHLEGLQYRLRQFAIILWTLILSVGFGVTKLTEVDVRLIAAGGLVPLLFLYIDAWYARSAQRFRARRHEIAFFINEGREMPSTGIKKPTTGGIVLLDFTASLTRSGSPHALYKENLFVKLSRTVRVSFYGFQIVSTAVLLTFLVLSGKHHRGYLLAAVFMFLVVPLIFICKAIVWWRAGVTRFYVPSDDLIDELVPRFVGESDENPSR